MTPPDTDTSLDSSPHDPIGKLLVEAGLVTQEHLDQALAKQRAQGGKTFELLISMECLGKDALHDFLSRQPGVASIDLANYELDDKLRDLIPQELAEKNLLLPIDKMGRNLTVAMACPLDAESIAKVEQHSGLRVKAMLCRLDDMRAGVKKFYRIGEPEGAAVFQDALLRAAAAPPNKKVILSAIERLECLPYSPDIAGNLLRWSGDGSVPFRHLADALLTDPALAGWLLGSANSAAFGLTQQVQSVALAAALLGRDGIAFLMTNALPKRPPDEKPLPFDYGALRSRAVFCGLAARSIAESTGRGKSDAAFSAGLFHELGRVALVEAKRDRYAKIDPALLGGALAEAETKAFGTAFPEAGYTLLRAWRVPDAVAQPVRFHLQPDEAEDAYQDNAWIVNLASTLAMSSSTDAPLSKEQALENGQRAMKALGLKPENVGKLIAQTTVAATALL